MEMSVELEPVAPGQGGQSASTGDGVVDADAARRRGGRGRRERDGDARRTAASTLACPSCTPKRSYGSVGSRKGARCSQRLSATSEKRRSTHSGGTSSSCFILLDEHERAAALIAPEESDRCARPGTCPVSRRCSRRRVGRSTAAPAVFLAAQLCGGRVGRARGGAGAGAPPAGVQRRAGRFDRQPRSVEATTRAVSPRGRWSSRCVEAPRRLEAQSLAALGELDLSLARPEQAVGIPRTGSGHGARRRLRNPAFIQYALS